MQLTDQTRYFRCEKYHQSFDLDFDFFFFFFCDEVRWVAMNEVAFLILTPVKLIVIITSFKRRGSFLHLFRYLCSCLITKHWSINNKRLLNRMWQPNKDKMQWNGGAADRKQRRPGHIFTTQRNDQFMLFFCKHDYECPWLTNITTIAHHHLALTALAVHCAPDPLVRIIRRVRNIFRHGLTRNG